MRALVLNDEIRGEIGRIVKHAKENPVPLAVIKEIMAGNASPVGDNPQHVCTIPVGYRAVFSIEEHPGGWMRHISISVPGGKLPHPAAIESIAKEFGFADSIEDCERWVEDLGDVRAVNLVQKIEQPAGEKTS
jgi:hypothetical protein